MRIVFMGTPDFAVPTLRALYEDGHTVEAVFTQPDKPRGRGYKLMPPPVKVLAQEHGTAVYQPQSLKKDADEYIKILEDIKPDCIVVAAYGKILPKAVLDIPKYGCVNVHGSLLPKYRGAAPIQWSVLDGEKETGITTMLMAEGLDTGDILLQRATDIGENETAAELFDRLADMGAEVLLETLKCLEEGSVRSVPQDDSAASYAKMLDKSMCNIDFSKSAFEVHKKICGLSDWPCAVTVLFGKRLKVYRSEIIKGAHGGEAGITLDDKLTVACADGAVRLTEVQAEGSKRMRAEDYLRGKPVPAGTKLGI
ncbi:MAG: methionyl-tRNA formyltransferase [Ruminococcus sp.]|nr:methionyl-tRNA formyltransferase [Ruminococcus sp.]